MKTFYLPDLGEGLTDAIVREWHVAEGDLVQAEQAIVSVETAKAIVDVPSPYTGIVKQLHAAVDETVETGAALFDIEEEQQATEAPKPAATVVGEIKSGNTVLQESATGIQSSAVSSERPQAMPAVRLLAEQMGVDLNTIKGSGPHGAILVRDICKDSCSTAIEYATPPDNAEKLPPHRQGMALQMQKIQQQIVPISIMDQADIVDCYQQCDLSVRMIRAVQYACEQNPMINSLFYPQSMSFVCNKKINLGVAVDVGGALYVPVIRDIAQQSDQDLRAQIDAFKQKAEQRSFSAEDQSGATLILSNFGMFGGQYATPLMVPPMVAIIAMGSVRQSPCVFDDSIVAHPFLPISVSVDHRFLSGAEAAQFLKALKYDLETTQTT